MGNSRVFLAKPSGPCCLKGTIHEGEPRGRMTTISGIETYISTPPEGKANGHILLYFPDVWGLFNNGLLIMDGFAEAGYLVLGLDYFRGVSVQKVSLMALLDLIWNHRTQYGSTERIDMITQIRILITRLGKESTLLLLMSMFRGGSRR